MPKQAAGYFLVSRKILDHWVSDEKPFDTFHAWVWLIANANYKPVKREFRGQLITIGRGQLVTSYAALGEAWGWSRNKVIRYTSKLENDGMITKKCNTFGTTLTLENYAFYQDARNTNGAADGATDGAADGTHKNKRERKINNSPGNARTRAGGGPFSEEDLKDPRVAAWERRKAEERARRQKGEAHDK